MAVGIYADSLIAVSICKIVEVVFIRAEDINRVESESGIIATLIHHPEFSFHSEFLEPKHFTNRENRLVYESITGMAKDGISTVDPYNIMEYLQLHDSENANVLTVSDLQELMTMSDVLARSTIAEYDVLVSNVWDAAFRREMSTKLSECQGLCFKQNEDNVKQKIYNLIDDVMTSYSYNDDIDQYTDKIDVYWNEIKSRQGTGYAGIPFKFPALNDYVTIERGELVIFGAQQKVGKSIMLLNCAVDLLRQGYSVLYIDSELSSRLFTARLFSHLTGIEYRDLTSGNYTAEDEQKILAAKDWIKSKYFQHIYLPFFDSDSIYTAVKKMNHLHPVDVLIVDYFKSTGNEMDAFQTYASMGKCVDVIKNEIAGAMNIAAIGAAQATINNRLADSAKIARNASTIIMLVDKTKDEIVADGKECGNKKMIVTVNRNGMQHAQGEYIDLMFNGNVISYEQAKQHIPQTPY